MTTAVKLYQNGTPVGPDNPLYTSGSGGGGGTGGGDANAANQVVTNTNIGATTETAAASDTATAGLNGRLQRIAQRLTSHIAQFPATLGQKAKTASLAVTLASDEDLLDNLGVVTETAPASDTASSGLNGRLQRVAQRVSSLISLFPTSLGQKAKTASLAVTLASDEDVLAQVGAVDETAPATDIASVGLNGRLQRVAQRVTSLIALYPASVGQKAKAGSFAVTLASDEDLLAREGALTETAPATDTASSGLNGRLQRVAQRLTSLIALYPASIGQKAKAASFAVTLASDEDLLARQGALTETAPASDTASSGLNGRLQRVAQNITSLIAKFPTALTTGGNLSVGVAEALPAGSNIIGNVGISSVVQPTNVQTGKVTVPTPGTKVQLTASSIPLVDTIEIKALAANGHKIYVGNSGVTAANGFELTAGQSKIFVVDNVNRIYIDVETGGGGEGVTWGAS